MNGILLLVICSVCLLAGYVFYGRYLCKKWGVGENDQPTPAHTMEDGVDYVPAPAPVLMGHHFSSIAGAGPITGPISAVAAGFGWGACALWIVIGGIFFGGVHDFGALFASVRHGGKSIGEIISANMSKRAKRLFIIFSYLTLILVVAAFSSIVAGTFAATFVEGAVDLAASEANARVAMVSLLFIVIAIVFGFAVYRRNVPMSTASVIGVLGIVAIIAIGMNFHPIYLSSKTWMWIVGIYITVASVAPVWILLQPRDYLSSFLLYAMLALAVIAVLMGNPSMSSLPVLNTPNNPTPVFPVLFTTIACGAISGFHSLVSSGTTSKQLDKETDAKPIAYGGMLLECVLAILTLCATAYAYSLKGTEFELSGATAIFGGGIAGTYAAKAAVGMDAQVTLLDINLNRLSYLEDVFGASVTTLYSTDANIRKCLAEADLVIGSVLIPGGSTPKLIRREHLKLMKKGAVIVDIAIDQGGCCESSHTTTHDNPVFIEEGVVHYCVGNMPGAVPYTSTIALSNSTFRYGMLMADYGLEAAARMDAGLANGINIYAHQCTNQNVAKSLGLDYTNAFDLMH